MLKMLMVVHLALGVARMRGERRQKLVRRLDVRFGEQDTRVSGSSSRIGWRIGNRRPCRAAHQVREAGPSGGCSMMSARYTLRRLTDSADRAVAGMVCIDAGRPLTAIFGISRSASKRCRRRG